jgi:hypothetical protein
MKRCKTELSLLGIIDLEGIGTKRISCGSKYFFALEKKSKLCDCGELAKKRPQPFKKAWPPG